MKGSHTSSGTTWSSNSTFLYGCLKQFCETVCDNKKSFVQTLPAGFKDHRSNNYENKLGVKHAAGCWCGFNGQLLSDNKLTIGKRRCFKCCSPKC